MHESSNAFSILWHARTIWQWCHFVSRITASTTMPSGAGSMWYSYGSAHSLCLWYIFYHQSIWIHSIAVHYIWESGSKLKGAICTCRTLRGQSCKCGQKEQPSSTWKVSSRLMALTTVRSLATRCIANFISCSIPRAELLTVCWVWHCSLLLISFGRSFAHPIGVTLSDWVACCFVITICYLSFFEIVLLCCKCIQLFHSRRHRQAVVMRAISTIRDNYSIFTIKTTKSWGRASPFLAKEKKVVSPSGILFCPRPIRWRQVLLIRYCPLL